MFCSLNEHGEVVLNDEMTLTDCIVHIADDATSSPQMKPDEPTHFIKVKKRMKLRKFSREYPFMYKEGFGFGTDGKPIIVKDITNPESSLRHVRSYGEWQPIVNRLICKKIQALIEPSSHEDPEAFIENLINQGWTKSKRNKAVVKSFKQDKSAKT